MRHPLQAPSLHTPPAIPGTGLAQNPFGSPVPNVPAVAPAADLNADIFRDMTPGGLYLRNARVKGMKRLSDVSLYHEDPRFAGLTNEEVSEMQEGDRAEASVQQIMPRVADLDEGQFQLFRTMLEEELRSAPPVPGTPRLRMPSIAQAAAAALAAVLTPEHAFDIAATPFQESLRQQGIEHEEGMRQFGIDEEGRERRIRYLQAAMGDESQRSLARYDAENRANMTAYGAQREDQLLGAKRAQDLEDEGRKRTEEIEDKEADRKFSLELEKLRSEGRISVAQARAISGAATKARAAWRDPLNGAEAQEDARLEYKELTGVDLGAPPKASPKLANKEASTRFSNAGAASITKDDKRADAAQKVSEKRLERDVANDKTKASQWLKELQLNKQKFGHERAMDMFNKRMAEENLKLRKAAAAKGGKGGKDDKKDPLDREEQKLRAQRAKLTGEIQGLRAQNSDGQHDMAIQQKRAQVWGIVDQLKAINEIRREHEPAEPERWAPEAGGGATVSPIGVGPLATIQAAKSAARTVKRTRRSKRGGKPKAKKAKGWGTQVGGG